MQTFHKLDNNYTKEVLALLQKFWGPQISQPWNPAKELRTLREVDFRGQWYLITELPQNWRNRLLEGTNKTLCTPGHRKRSSDSTGDWARLACECLGVFDGGVGQQLGAPNTTVLGAAVCWYKSFWRRCHYCHYPAIVWPEGGTTAPPRRRKLD